MVKRTNGFLDSGNNWKNILRELAVIAGYVLVIALISVCLFSVGAM